ncbi:MAG: glycosyl hydrolase family 18 protein [Deinococcales bacterium]
MVRRYFSDVALTEESREHFVASCIDLFIKGNLPIGEALAAKGTTVLILTGNILLLRVMGITIIGRLIAKTFTLLLAEFRRQLEPYPNTRLSIAAPSTQVRYRKLELDSLQHYVDWINLMTYEFRSSAVGLWTDACGKFV